MKTQSTYFRLGRFLGPVYYREENLVPPPCANPAMHSSTSTFKAILYCILLCHIGFTDGEAPKMSLLLVYKCMCSYKISLVFIKFLCVLEPVTRLSVVCLPMMRLWLLLSLTCL
jgi:hypothetical protein